MQLSLRWARALASAPSRAGRATAMRLFGIVQGGDDHACARQSAARAGDIGFDGYAVGGLAVGEPQEVMFRIVDGNRAGAAGGRARAT